MRDNSGKSGKKIAIVGMACLYPGAPDLATFWSNIVGGVDAIRDVRDSEWSSEQYYEPDSRTFGKTYCKRGGFISEFARFDALQAGVMPGAIAGSDPDQFLALTVAQNALTDAGYAVPSGNRPLPAGAKPLNAERAEVILGRISAPGAGSMNLIQQSKTVSEISDILTQILPDGNEAVVENVTAQLKERLKPCTSDNIPGVMPNILAGRIAAKLGFRGRSLLVDAACASSMVSVETAVDDLLSGRCDFALAGGLHVNSSAVMFNLFAGLGALSRSETIRPFDENADGTLLGEGLGMICLKRLEDAVRDGDKIYATICGIASTSDGHGGSVIAPSLEGEALAMRKAYEMGGISPATVELLEAHGTGTPVGDAIELEAIRQVFAEADNGKQNWCAVGSVKSMIGHCQSASAIAGIIKAALALYHKVLPPTLNVENPTSKVDWKKHPCYINSSTRPWLRSYDSEHPRRAAVSAFGFGGINSHTILEEPETAKDTDSATAALAPASWDCELFTFAAESQSALDAEIVSAIRFFENAPHTSLADLAFSLNCGHQAQREPADYRLAIVASSTQDLLNKLQKRSGDGVYLGTPEKRLGGKLAFLYPGLGSAYTGMLGDLCLHFPEVRRVFEIVDTVAARAGAPVRPSDLIFPRAGEKVIDLASADFAVVAVLLAEYALHELLQHLEIKPDAQMGCSTGEFAAITTGGAVDVLKAAETFYKLSTDVGRKLPTEESAQLKSLRVLASVSTVMPLAERSRVYLAADLGDDHIIVSGSAPNIEELSQALRAQKIVFQTLPAPIAYHTPLVGNIVDGNDSAIKAIGVGKLAVPTWSCSSAGLFVNDTAAIRKSFTRLFAKPIALRETILAMYADGVRKFIEVGPNAVLTLLISGILQGKPHLAAASNVASRSGLAQLQHLLANLFVQGVEMKLDYLYVRRNVKVVDLNNPVPDKSKTGILLPLTHTDLRIDVEKLPPLHGFEDLYANAPLPVSEVSSEEAVMQSFLQTNAEFYARLNQLQENVLSTYLSLENQIEDSDTSTACQPQVDFYPLLRGAVYEADDNETGAVTFTLPVDLHTHLYLLDHAIGGYVSSSQPIRVHLMPLMVALEMMAEAAQAAAGGGVVARLEHVKAFRRIFVEANGTTIRLAVTVRAESSEELTLSVQLFQGDEFEPSMAADVVIAGTYAIAPAPRLSTSGTAPTKLTNRSALYAPGAMFHGPRMQSVLELDKVGNKQISGTAQARWAPNWLPDELTPRFAIDPLLLDNASQFVLFYLYEKNLSAIALLPFYIERMEFYRNCTGLYRSPDVVQTQQYNPDDYADLYWPQQTIAQEQDDFADFYNPHSEDNTQTVSVAATLQTVSERATEATVEVIGADGQLFCRIENIHSRRVIISDKWNSFIADPLNCLLSDITRVEPDAYISTIRRDALPEDDVILDWCADYLLKESERAAWRSRAKTAARRVDWLMGRIAAKDAVRQLLKTSGVVLGPHDIEIVPNEENAPQVVLDGHAHLSEIAVSISHNSGIAVAIAAHKNSSHPGIDIQEIRPREQGFAEMFLDASERRCLDDNAIGVSRDEMLTRLWTAKEAAFKAFQGTLDMSQIKVTAVSEDVHTVTLDAAGRRVNAVLQLHSDGAILAYALVAQPVLVGH